MGTATQTPVRERQVWAVGPGPPLLFVQWLLTFALVTSASIGWLALKIFCASCWGLGAGEKVQVRCLEGPTLHPPSSRSSHPLAAHRLSCFQRWKKSWAAISVGWKNLLMVTGSFRVRDWGAPPYLVARGGRGGKEAPSDPRPRLPPSRPQPLGRAPTPLTGSARTGAGASGSPADIRC